MTKKVSSKLSVVREKFEIKNIWTTTQLFKELKIVFPEEDEKTLRHRIRSAINTLRQKGTIKRIAPAKWKKINSE
jgi:hypothetical protein